MNGRPVCEQCRRVAEEQIYGPNGWTVIWFCSIPCLFAWRKARYTDEALRKA